MLGSLAFAGLAVLIRPGSGALAQGAAAAPDTRVAIRWRVPREQVKAVRERMPFEGEIVPDRDTTADTKGLPLVYVFAGIVALPYLADALLTLYREAAYGGIVVDATGDEIVIENDPRLGGRIVVRGEDGVKIYEADEVADPSELVGVLLRARGGA